MTLILFNKYLILLNFLILISLNSCQDLYEGSECELAAGGNGICTIIDECKWAIDGIVTNGDSFYEKILQEHCTWGHHEIICCPPSSSTSSNQPQTNLDNRKSEIACEEYGKTSVSTLSYHILNGFPTDLGEFPHMVALGYPSQQTGIDYEFKCGGTLINDRYILTAAHCVVIGRGGTVPTLIRMGKLSITSDLDDVSPVDRQISKIIPHPNFRTSRKYDDIALLLMDSPVTFNDYVRPACLNKNMNDIDSDVELIVTGWGVISTKTNENSKILLKTNLTGMPLDMCNTSILRYNPRDITIPMGLKSGQICAYDPDAKKDACQGDSGGPLQIVQSNGLSLIIGIVSFGISCGTPLPSVYTRIAYYLNWIESIAWAD